MSTFVALVSLVFQIYQFLILIRVLLSWVSVHPYRSAISHPAVQLLYRITDPVLRPLRRLIPPIGGTLDITPVVALILLEILRRMLVSLLIGL